MKTKEAERAAAKTARERTFKAYLERETQVTGKQLSGVEEEQRRKKWEETQQKSSQHRPARKLHHNCWRRLASLFSDVRQKKVCQTSNVNEAMVYEPDTTFYVCREEIKSCTLQRQMFELECQPTSGGDLPARMDE